MLKKSLDNKIQLLLVKSHIKRDLESFGFFIRLNKLMKKGEDFVKIDPLAEENWDN